MLTGHVVQLALSLLGIAMILAGWWLGNDISRGQQGYDSVYYRHYTPYTGPFSSTLALEQIRNLPVGGRAWVRSGAGCEYLIEHAHDSRPGFTPMHLGVVYEARSRWGLPCHEASWWSGGSGIAEGPVDDGIWRARRHREGGGVRTRWTRVGTRRTVTSSP